MNSVQLGLLLSTIWWSRHAKKDECEVWGWLWAGLSALVLIADFLFWLWARR